MKQPARLNKQTYSKGDLFMNRFGHILVALLIILLMVLIATVIIAFVDMASAGNMTVTMTDSNQYYYHLKDVI